MPMTDWPKEDRPREKLLLHGEQTLTDAELIAIFLKTGTRAKTALDIARELLIKYGDLKKLLQASAQHLTQQPGIGQTKYATLKAAVELGRRYLNETILTPGCVLNCSQITQQFLADRLRENTNEVFACLFMDSHYRLIRFKELFQGTINQTNVYIREIMRQGIAYNAAKVILAHNHPSGLSEPSTADKEVTLLIKQALALIDIDVVDHIIIGNPGCFSFADKRLI